MRHYKGEIGTSMTTFRITKEMKERAGTGVYRLTKEEREDVKQQTKINMKKQAEEKEFREKVHNTTFAKLSLLLNTDVNPELIRKCDDRYKNLGNGKYKIKCIDQEMLIIRIKPQKGVALTMKIVG